MANNSFQCCVPIYFGQSIKLLVTAASTLAPSHLCICEIYLYEHLVNFLWRKAVKNVKKTDPHVLGKCKNK